MSTNEIETADQMEVNSPPQAPIPEKRVKRRPSRKTMRADGMCEGPACSKIVPGSVVTKRKKHYFCSKLCESRFNRRRHVIGTCEHCAGPIMGDNNPSRNPRFCSQEHRRQYLDEQLMGPTGTFRELLEEYLKTYANFHYRNTGKRQPRHHLAQFFRYAVQEEKITQLDDIRPSVISRFVAYEISRGISCLKTIGYLSRFFDWLIAEERVDMSNPVRPRIHNPKRAPSQPRPYSDEEIRALWRELEAAGDLSLLLAFAIGEECGLRISEVANIRMSDLDTEHQRIHVRLPTKNQMTRQVPYHDKVAELLAAWLKQRDPDVPHDHLLHTMKLKVAYNQNRLDVLFRRVFSSKPTLSGPFRFHRLRHTWATRLMNNGMELSTLKQLGGWISLGGMQGYIRVQPETIRRQYEAAYAKLQEKLESEPEETVSLLEFAKLNKQGDATCFDSMA
jgi:integrase